MFKRIRKVSHFDSNRKFRVIFGHFHGHLKENSTPKLNFTHHHKKLELMLIMSGLTKTRILKSLQQLLLSWILVSCGGKFAQGKQRGKAKVHE